MSRSFDLVDDKLAEADFFLKRLESCDCDLFSVNCYFSAFVSAARSVTYSLQAVLCDMDGFEEWYEAHQSVLRQDEYARFFHQARRLGQHVGTRPIRAGHVRSKDRGEAAIYYFHPCADFPQVPEVDVATACHHYIRSLVEIVFDCYLQFGRLIDPAQYYTEEAYRARSLTIEDAEEEIIGIRGWTRACDLPLDYRWQMLRDSMPGCGIDHLFDEYLGKVRPAPKRIAAPSPETIRLPPGWSRKGQWVLPPGYEDIESYLQALRTGKNVPSNDWLEGWFQENRKRR